MAAHRAAARRADRRRDQRDEPDAVGHATTTRRRRTRRFDWGVWAFQDVFDFRFFDYYAKQNVAAVMKALDDMHDVRVSGTASYFDKFHKQPDGPRLGRRRHAGRVPPPYTDHDLSVVQHREHRQPGQTRSRSRTSSTSGQHPEDLDGLRPDHRRVPGDRRAIRRPQRRRRLDLHAERDRHQRGRARPAGTRSTSARSSTTPSTSRWSGRARQLADGVIENVNDIRAQRPNARHERDLLRRHAPTTTASSRG